MTPLKPTTHIYPNDATPLRLDLVVAELFSISRSQAQHVLQKNQITRNGKTPKKAGDIVRPGDVIEYTGDHHHLPTEPSPENVGNKISTTAQPITPHIIMESPHFIIIEKPSGLLTHETQAHEQHTVASFMAQTYPEIQTVGDSPERPGIVHRLDKEASGLMVIARTTAMFNHLKEQFKNRTVGKHYTVLVHDPMPRVEGTIDFPIERSENAERMAAVPKTEKGLVTDKGKEALTDFLVIKNYVNFSLLDVTIHTGRMHQIRAHMFAYNHPVVGDPLYIQKKRPRTWDDRCGRLFLHCSKLSFTDLDGLPQEFESDLPSDLVQFLGTLV